LSTGYLLDSTGRGQVTEFNARGREVKETYSGAKKKKSEKEKNIGKNSCSVEGGAT